MRKSQGGNQRKEHDELVDKILVKLSAMGIFCWPHPTGGAFRGKAFLKFGLKGSSDIVAIMRNGMFWGIEVKTGDAEQEPDQKRFEGAVRRVNGHYTVARSVNDVINYYISIGNP